MATTTTDVKRVLVFNSLKRLISIYQSAFAVAKANDWNLSSIRSACTGKIMSFHKLYFRYLDENVEVGIDDLGVLNLDEYDSLCGVTRKTYPDSKMSRKNMKYNTKSKIKSPFYPFKEDPNGKVESQSN